tara:strand:+ start:130 stop:378 length:249 start_codon:yes stop_codon:yes gene_type:complete
MIGQQVVVVRAKIAEETKQNKTQFFNVLLEIDQIGMFGFYDMGLVIGEWKENVVEDTSILWRNSWKKIMSGKIKLRPVEYYL